MSLGRRVAKRGLSAICIVAISLLAAPAQSQAPRFSRAIERIEIRAKAIDHFLPRDPEQLRFGHLKFRGGLELTSGHREFGGLSSIRVAPDGRNFIAVTDNAHWLRGRIEYRGDAPSAIAEADIAPILDADGNPLTVRRWYDSEALAEDGDFLFVAIERVHRILRFNYRRDGLTARGEPVSVPPQISALPRNKGIECLAALPQNGAAAATLIAISERGLDKDGNTEGFLLGAQPTRFSLVRSDDFDVTDCATTPDRNFLVLERHFSLRRGVELRLRRIPLSAIAADARLEGEILLQADFGYQIDNMEGLAVHRDAAGAVVLTLVSDDNFSPIQRTLLLQFTLIE